MLRFVFALGLLGGIASAQQCNIPLWALQGSYAVAYQGTLAMLPPSGTPAPPQMAPGVLLGVLTYDPTGNITGSATLAIGGVIGDYNVVGGSIVLNPDCSGTATLKVVPSGAPPGTPAGTEIDKIVYVPAEHKFLTMQYQLTMPAIPMVLGTWTRLDPPHPYGLDQR